LPAPNAPRRRRILRRPACSTAPQDPFESGAEVRYTDAAGPPEAISDARALFLWNFLSRGAHRLTACAPAGVDPRRDRWGPAAVRRAGSLRGGGCQRPRRVRPPDRRVRTRLHSRPTAARGGYGLPRRGTNRTRFRQDLGTVVLTSDLAAHVGWGRYARIELAGQDVVKE
jgi:hypothetical protein